jgi:hypothetical protein
MTIFKNLKKYASIIISLNLKEKVIKLLKKVLITKLSLRTAKFKENKLNE